MAATIFAVFTLLLVIRMPVSFSLAISAAVALVFAGSMDPLIVVQRMYTSVESFSLIAIPFFILSGGFMEHGGISRRLISFSSSLVGHIRGGLSMISIVAAMFFAGISGSTAADTAAVGSVLNIKPVLHVDDEGRLVPVTKVRGRKASLRELVNRGNTARIFGL